jgi:hypothetical protein
MEGLIIKKWDSLGFNPKSVLGLEILCTQGELFEKLIKEYKFDEWVESIENKGMDSIDIQSNYAEEHLRQLKKLKEDIKKCKPKITIKIELEKYES